MRCAAGIGRVPINPLSGRGLWSRKIAIKDIIQDINPVRVGYPAMVYVAVQED